MPRPYEVEIEKMPRRIDKATRWSRKEERTAQARRRRTEGTRGEIAMRAQKSWGQRPLDVFACALFLFDLCCRSNQSVTVLQSANLTAFLWLLRYPVCRIGGLCFYRFLSHMSPAHVVIGVEDKRLRGFILSPGGFAHRIKSATSVKRGCLCHCRDTGISRAVPSFFSVILTNIGVLNRPKGAGRIAQNLWTDLRATWR